MYVESVALGLIIGLLVAFPVFVSRKLATGVLLQLSIAIATAFVLSGTVAVNTAIAHTVTEIQQAPGIACGLLLGIIVAGLITTVFRSST